MSTDKLAIHAVILAGGRGTRFWPRSRTRTPKQLLNIVGKETMLEQTVARLRPLIPAGAHLDGHQRRAGRGKCASSFRAPARRRVLTEPVGRNTAAAIALAALHVRHAARGDALMAVLPADHYIANPERYRVIVRAALEMARDEPGRMVVLGIPPTRPETGFGYIERMGEALDSRGFPVFAVRRFTEKPALARRERVRRLRRLSLERRDVFLARLHVSRQPEELFAEDARCARVACRKHRQAQLRKASRARCIPRSRIFPWTTRSSNLRPASKAGPASL